MLSQIHLANGYAYVAAGLAGTGLGTGASVAAAMTRSWPPQAVTRPAWALR